MKKHIVVNSTNHRTGVGECLCALPQILKKLYLTASANRLALLFILIVFMILIHVQAPVYAHDGSDHTSDLEVWVSGIGIIAMILACIYSLWWKNPDRKQFSKKHQENIKNRFNPGDFE